MSVHTSYNILLTFFILTFLKQNKKQQPWSVQIRRVWHGACTNVVSLFYVRESIHWTITKKTNASFTVRILLPPTFIMKCNNHGRCAAGGTWNWRPLQFFFRQKLSRDFDFVLGFFIFLSCYSAFQVLPFALYHLLAQVCTFKKKPPSFTS